jgi:hypothetical protein
MDTYRLDGRRRHFVCRSDDSTRATCGSPQISPATLTGLLWQGEQVVKSGAVGCGLDLWNQTAASRDTGCIACDAHAAYHCGAEAAHTVLMNCEEQVTPKREPGTAFVVAGF